MKKIFLLLAALALLAAPSIPAQTIGVFTGLPASVAPLATSNNLATSAVQIHPRQGLAVMPNFAMTAAGSNSTVVITLQVNPDTNSYKWSTVGGPAVTMTGNSTNEVVGYTNFGSTNFVGVQYVRVLSIQNNGTNTLYPSNIVYSITD
jgi:hypothetical protein